MALCGNKFHLNLHVVFKILKRVVNFHVKVFCVARGHEAYQK